MGSAPLPEKMQSVSVADTDTVAVKTAQTVAVQQSRELALAAGIRFSQLDAAAQDELISTVKESFGDSPVAGSPWKTLMRITRARLGYTAFCSFFLLVGLLLVEFRRPNPVFSILIFASFVSLLFSVGAALTFAFVTIEVRFKLSGIELDARKRSVMSKGEES